MSKVCDKSLVLPWSDNLISEEPYEYPFLIKYQSEFKTLLYIAALHTSEEDSETFNLIESILNEDHIDLVIVEGISNDLGETPANIQKWACSQGQNKKYVGFETAFTIKQASSKNIPFIGGEPSELKIIESLKESGFNIFDYIYYTFTQQLFQMKEGGFLGNEPIDKLFNNHLQEKLKYLTENRVPSFNNYIDWYKKHNLADFSVDNLLPEVCAPYVKGELLTQRISSAICIFRDQFTVEVIEKSLSRYNNVLIVYGGSHWSTQKDVLLNYLGNPTFSKYSK